MWGMGTRDELQIILARSARKLRRTRMAESAAVSATAGAALAAALTAAAWVGPGHPVTLWALALLPAAGLGILLAVPSARSALALPDGWAMGLLVGLVGVGVGGAALLAAMPSAPAGILTPACVAGFALAGAVGGGKRRAAAEAARYIDRREGLRDRLATAAELLARPGPGDDPVQAIVLEQSLDALRDGRAVQAGMWRRGRATVLSLVLAAGLWALLAGSAAIARPGPVGPAAADDDALVLTAWEQQQLADAIVRAARQAQNPAAASAINQAAQNVRQGLPLSLSELARQAGLSEKQLLDLLPASAAERIAAVGQLQDAHQASGAAGATAPSSAPVEPAGPRWVRVFEPGRAGGAARGDPAGEGPNLPELADAWQQARRRAGENLQSGQTPAEYRELIRRYFDVGGMPR